MSDNKELMVDISGLEGDDEVVAPVAAQDNKAQPAKPEQKVEDQPAAQTPAAKEEPPVVPQTQQAPAAPVDPLAELELTENEVKLITKQMSPYAKELAIARIKELREERKQRIELAEEVKKLREEASKPRESIYEAPDAYLLDPQYLNAAQERKLNETIAKFCRHQKALGLQGKPVRTLVRDKQGNIQVVDKEVEPTGEILTDLDDFLSDAKFAARQAEQEERRIIATYESGATNFRGKVNALTSAMLPDWDATLTKLPAVKESYSANIKAFSEAGHPPSSSPYIDAIVKLYTLNQALGNALNEERKKVATTAQQRTIATTVGPTNTTHFDAGTSRKAVKEGHIALDDKDIANY